MATKQNRFMFFANFADTIRTLPEHKQAEAYKALCEFGIYGILPEDETLRVLCLIAKGSVYKEDGRKNNGGNHNPTGKNQYSEPAQEVNSVNSGQFLSRTETETETETEKSVKKIDRPTLQQVLVYAKEQNQLAGVGGFRCSKQTAEAFWTNYESNGWVIGNESRTPIVDWKAKLRQWALRDNLKTCGGEPDIAPKQAKGER